MAKGTVTLVGTTVTTILVADKNRDHILIQAQSNHDTYFGFGEAAVDATGICLLEPGATIKVKGPKARFAISAVSTGTAILGWETMEEIEYQSGQFAGPWPLT